MKNSFVGMLLTICLLSMYSCGIIGSNDNDDNSVNFTDGISDDVWEFMSEDLKETVEVELGVPVNRGENPPNINEIFETPVGAELVFLIKPFELLSSTVPSDAGHVPRTFNDLYAKFSNQDMSSLTIDIDLTHRNSPPIAGTGGFIVGENNLFTIFGPLVQRNDSYEVQIVHILSGRLSSDGITDLSLGIVMIENDGDPSAIPNEAGRHFIDKEKISELSSWPESSSNAGIQELSSGTLTSNVVPL